MERVRRYGGITAVLVICLFFLFSLPIDEGQESGEANQEKGPETVCESGDEKGADMKCTEPKTAMVRPVYVPQAGYRNVTMGGRDYVCWKDLLILGEDVWRETDGVYRRSGERIETLFGLQQAGGGKPYDRVRQERNLLVTRRVNTFLVRNMDTGTIRSYRCGRLMGNTEITVSPCWYLYDGAVYYTVSVARKEENGEDKDADEAHENAVTMLRRINLSDDSEELLYVPTEAGWRLREQFMIRDDGVIVTELVCEEDLRHAWLCLTDQEGVTGKWTEIRYRRERGSEDNSGADWLAFNKGGLFVGDGWGREFGNTPVYCWQDNGSGREIGIRKPDEAVFTDYGYLHCGDLSLYDLWGNKKVFSGFQTGTAEGTGYADDDAYFLKHVVFDGEQITVFYENRESGILQIEQAMVQEKEKTADAPDVMQMVRERRAVISVTSKEEQGNIAGYRFEKELCTTGGYFMTYAAMPDSLLHERAAGKGVYVSAQFGAAQAYLGEVLSDILSRRGGISEEYEALFSAYATSQAQELSVKLPQGWQADRCRYDVSFVRNHLYGENGYDFLYVFHEAAKERRASADKGRDDVGAQDDEGETEVRILVSVDGGGIIRGLGIRTEQRDTGRCRYGMKDSFLPDDCGQEQIVRDGRDTGRKLVLNYESHWSRYMDGMEMRDKIAAGLPGLAVGEDALETAVRLERIFRDVLESRGEYIPQYRSLFADMECYEDFLETGWEDVQEEWAADSGWDCYVTDRTGDEGVVKFRYYFYPDFGKIPVHEAEAVILTCELDAGGRIGRTDMLLTSISKEEREKARTREDGSQPLVLGGKAVNDVGAQRYEEGAEIWEDEDIRQAAVYLGETIKTELNERKIESGEVYTRFTQKEKARELLRDMEWCRELAGSRWKAGDGWDCYLVEDGRRADCVHLRYYFYRYKGFEGQNRSLVTDLWLSRQGIEDMRTRMAVYWENDNK